MYRGENGTLMDAQAIEPRLQALNATTAAHTATLLAHETKLDAHEAAQAAQGGRLDTLDDTVAAQASDIQAAGERMDATEEATAAILLAGDNGLEIHTGAEDGGHVRIFADEIDLNGPVQVLDNDGQLVNINNLPSAVEELRAQMNGVVGELDATLTAAKEELRDLRSRCNGAYEYEVAPYTPTSDRLCRKLTTVGGAEREARRTACAAALETTPLPLLCLDPSPLLTVHVGNVRGPSSKPDDRPHVQHAQDLPAGHLRGRACDVGCGEACLAAPFTRNQPP